MANYDPSKEACPPMFNRYEKPGAVLGPAGRTNNIENDEKGMLDGYVLSFRSTHRQAELGSNHDPMRQGIYRTNSVGDND